MNFYVITHVRKSPGDKFSLKRDDNLQKQIERFMDTIDEIIFGLYNYTNGLFSICHSCR